MNRTPLFKASLAVAALAAAFALPQVAAANDDDTRHRRTATMK
jgi:hypothetical protein